MLFPHTYNISSMEYLKCKACGCYSMVPLEVSVENNEWLHVEDDDSRFYSCHVCGDNWLSVRHVDDNGICQITFVHQMGVEPTLKRVAHLLTQVIIKPETVDHWDYYLDEDEIGEDEWFDRLDARRRTLRAICTN